MNFNYLYIILLSLISTCAIYLVILVRNYKFKFADQNICLIQLYLYKKFIFKLLNAAIDVTHHGNDVVGDILNDIKEYFNLEDIVLYDSNNIINKPTPGVYLRNVIARHIKDNKKIIFEKLAGNDIVIDRIESEKIKCSLYILSLSVLNQQQVVAFVHNRDSPLERHDIDTLAKPIKGILIAALNLRGNLADFG